MKEFKDLAGRYISILTTQRPLVTREEILDDEGNPTGEFNEAAEEQYVEGEVKHITAQGWLVLDLEYRGSLFTYMCNPNQIIYLTHQERTPEAAARDVERAKVLAASKSKAKVRSGAK